MHIPKMFAEEVPRMGNGVTAAIGLFLVKLMGWRFEGEFPKEKKLMVALAPHTSNWDFIVAMPFILALKVKVSYMMKKEAFIWPFKSLFVWLGGIPIDRKAPTNVVQQVTSAFKENDKMWVAITPEGTRKRVAKWQSGFLRIAYLANVPIMLVAWDFPNKCICLDSLYQPTGNLEADMREIQRRFSKYQGCHPQNQTPFIED